MVDPKILALQDKIDHLEHVIKELTVGKVRHHYWWAQGLTITEAKVAAFLETHKGIVTRDQIMTAIYWDRPNLLDTLENRCVDSHIKRIRLKLPVVRIRTVYKEGYVWVS